jgi:hypothetical protein
VGLHQIKKFLYIKGNNYQNQEITHRLGNNLCQLFTGEKVIIQNIQRLQKSSAKKPNNQINKWVSELNRQFLEVQMTNKYTKESSTSLTKEDIQFKMPLKYHLTSPRIVVIKDMNNKTAGKDEGEKDPHTLLVEM